jgi:hypothetical protein
VINQSVVAVLLYNRFIFAPEDELVKPVTVPKDGSFIVFEFTILIGLLALVL